MTDDDDFTRAAEDAADRATRIFIGDNDAAYGYSIGHTDGAEWARTHLTKQDPTDAEAIAYLAAFVEDLPPGEDAEWTPDTIARVKRGLRAARRDEEKQDG